MAKGNGTVHLLPISAGVVLSACGIALLGIDLRSGVGGWTPILLQGLGLLGGTWCFVVATRRMKWSRAPESSSLPSVVLFPDARALVEPFLVSRVLVGQIVGFLGVIAVGTTILRRQIVRGPNAAPSAKDSLPVLVIACALMFVVLILGRLAAAITLGASAAAMVLVAGHRRWCAGAIVSVLVLLFCWQLQAGIARISARQHLRSAISGLRDVRSAPLADWLTSGQPYRRGHWSWMFNLPPDLARNVTVVKVAGLSGLAGVVAVAVVFGVLAWSGVQGVRRAETLAERVMLAGMTVALVTPVLLQSVGGLLFVSARAGGPLPFIGYGPGELVLHWIMLAYVARQESPRRDERQPVLVTS